MEATRAAALDLLLDSDLWTACDLVDEWARHCACRGSYVCVLHRVRAEVITLIDRYRMAVVALARERELYDRSRAENR